MKMERGVFGRSLLFLFDLSLHTQYVVLSGLSYLCKPLPSFFPCGAEVGPEVEVAILYSVRIGG